MSESFEGENRVAMKLDSALQLKKLENDCVVQSGAGLKAGSTDAAYQAAGGEVLPDTAAVAAAADVIVKVRGPDATEARPPRKGQTLISFFWPAPNETLMKELADRPSRSSP